MCLCVFASLRMLLEKSSGERLFFSATVSEQAVTLRYGQSSRQTPLTISFRTEGRLTLDRWTHLVLQVTNLLEIPMVAWKRTALLNMPFNSCHKGCENRMVWYTVSLSSSLYVLVFDSLSIFFSSSPRTCGNYSGKHLLWRRCWGQGHTPYIRHTYTDNISKMCMSCTEN